MRVSRAVHVGFSSVWIRLLVAGEDEHGTRARIVGNSMRSASVEQSVDNPRRCRMEIHAR